MGIIEIIKDNLFFTIANFLAIS